MHMYQNDTQGPHGIAIRGSIKDIANELSEQAIIMLFTIGVGTAYY